MSRISNSLVFCISFFLFCAVASAQNTVTVPQEIAAYPDMVLHNGKVVTMDDTSFGLNTSRERRRRRWRSGTAKSRRSEAMTGF